MKSKKVAYTDDEGYKHFLCGVYLTDVSSQYAKATFNYLCEYARAKYKMKECPEFHYEFSTKTSEGSLYDLGEKKISCYLNLSDFNGKYWHYVEYSSIHKDPEIGSFKCKDWRPYLDNLIAHELAHAICHDTLKIKRGKATEFDDGVHCDKWKAVYRDLVRQTFVAPKTKKLKHNEFGYFQP